MKVAGVSGLILGLVVGVAITTPETPVPSRNVGTETHQVLVAHNYQEAWELCGTLPTEEIQECRNAALDAWTSEEEEVWT